ncbi:uncharacterized protein LOC143877768 [Tasmannia lanceolata]|uniref:uncharacterized protein LOC143877768 n=1 Tax=Tasmannia lanceolata TaxID=3420 RepID=UPI0040647D3B
MASIEVTGAYGYVVLVIVLYVILNTWMLAKVYDARVKLNIPYPTLYALDSESRNAKLFNCIQRGHQNSLEMMPIFFVLMLLGGVQHPWISTGLGLFYVVTRYFYFTGYSTGNPDNRLQIGEWNLLALLGLIFCTISLGIRLIQKDSMVNA